MGIWLDGKKDADDQLENELSPSHSCVEEVSKTAQGDKDLSKKPQRKRKRKSYGKDFEENDNEESDSSEENDSMYCFDFYKYQNLHQFFKCCLNVITTLVEIAAHHIVKFFVFLLFK